MNQIKYILSVDLLLFFLILTRVYFIEVLY